MWRIVARVILRKRVWFLVAIALITIFMAYQASFISMSYRHVQMLPEKDTAYLDYQYSKKLFGEQANIFVIGVKDTNFFQLKKFNDWISLNDTIKQMSCIDDVVSIAQIININKNSKEKKFELSPVFPKHINTQEELDSLVRVAKSLPFYKNLLYNDTNSVYLMAVSVSPEKLNTEERVEIVEDLVKKIEQYGEKYNLKFHYSGLPYIRTAVSNKVKKELYMFLVLAFLVCAFILYLFFRSFKAVFFPMLVVGIGVIWSMGSIVLFGYEITILTGMIPPLLIVIGVPNSIFMLNKYYSEYKRHGNKIKALQRVIQKTGNAIFLTNLTTASGFATFIITSSSILTEFGIIASLNIIGVFVLSLLLIPIFFSFFDPPKARHTKHLDNKRVSFLINNLINVTLNHRTFIYIVFAIIIGLGICGINLMKSTGYIVDDLPQDDPIYQDLGFFEKHFGGVMPLEILIDTKKKKGAINTKTFKKIEKLEKALRKYPELSRPISMIDAMKFLRQAFYKGNPRKYSLPNNMDKNFIMAYASKFKDKGNLINAYVDSTHQIARVSVQMKDIGTDKMKLLDEKIQADINTIFPPSKYNTILTGTSIIFFKGTRYLIKNLFVSLLLAIIIIALIMSWMFASFRMVIVSLIPNLIPLLLTGALMGYFGIPIKPSTILVFSVSFGISVDDTIHFLAKYRQELEVHEWDIKKSVIGALKETGVSMMYTSIVLFFGFAIFIASSFGGTAALGMLVSITLLFAMLSNLILLPSLLLTLERRITTKAFAEPLIQIFDEEEDIDIESLRIIK
ncbi:MAG: RND family transporter [Bacteroidetes bacterium]|nr:MAG: RND family transporter [Bacteroidota bacterium]